MTTMLDIPLLTPGWPVIGLAARDETLHILTTIILLIALWPIRRVNYLVVVCALAGSVLIDLDHLPERLGYRVLATPYGRPVTHSLATLAVVCLIGLICSGRWRTGALAIAFGLASHLYRDMATGGVPLFWPLDSTVVELEFGAYFLVMTGFVQLAAIVLMVGSRELPWVVDFPRVEGA